MTLRSVVSCGVCARAVGGCSSMEHPKRLMILVRNLKVDAMIDETGLFQVSCVSMKIYNGECKEDSNLVVWRLQW